MKEDNEKYAVGNLYKVDSAGFIFARLFVSFSMSCFLKIPRGNLH